MARPKSEPQEVEVRAESPEENPSETPVEWEVSQEFNEHVKALVALFVGQELQAFEQRLSDLEMLVGQPEGAVEFGSSPTLPDIPDFERKSRLDDIPWFGG